jgi:hypothetical protein
VRGANLTTAPTYTGVWTNIRMNVSERIELFFCSDDIDRCVKCTKRKWVAKHSAEQEMPPIPDVWSVKLGTNLKLTKILALETAGFQLPHKKPISLRRLFFFAPPPANLSAVPRGDHTPLGFVTTCDNGVFNGGVFMHLSIIFHSLFVDIKLL